VISRVSFGLSGVCLVALSMAGCSSTPPEQDPVHIKLNDLDTRLARIERVFTNQTMLDMVNQSEALRTDLRAMHNDIDQLANSQELSRKQQRDLYADLDRRLKMIESRSAGGAASPGSGEGGLIAAGAAGKQK